MINELPQIGDKYLITTNEWFYAPDGQSYRAVYGKINKIVSDSELLGMVTNRHSTNWYLHIGNMIVAGCQIYYAIKTDNCSKEKPYYDLEYEGKITEVESMSRIYFAEEPHTEITKEDAPDFAMITAKECR